MSITLYIYLGAYQESGPNSLDILKQNASYTKVLREGDSLTIGRSLSSDIYLEDSFISQTHCILNYHNSSILLRDNSRNGTYFQRKKITTLSLEPNKLYSIDISNRKSMIFGYMVESRFIPKANSEAISPKLMEGKCLGNFKIEKYEQSGGTSHIFTGRQISPSRQVVFKILKYSSALDSKSAKRFQRVARIASRLNHPGLAHLYHSDITLLELPEKRLNMFYFVFEFIQGKPIASMLQESTTLGIEFSLHTIIQIAQVLAYLHKKKIVHRNLAPSHIIIDQDKSARLVGLGLLKELDHDQIAILTGCHSIGVEGYAAPEQLLDGSCGDFRSDIFSLGAILYHCLCGRPPYTSKTKRELFRDDISGVIIPPDQLNPSLPFTLSKIIMKSLSRDPACRYDCMESFIQELSQYLEGKDMMRENFYALLQNTSFANSHVEMEILYKPLEHIGGDFYYYKYFEKENKMLLFLGDTTDHGTSAAFLAGMMVASCSLVAQMPASPKNLLETLHNALFSLFLSESSAEMISIVFDFNAKEITFSQAGYIPLLFYRKGSDPVALQKPGSRVAFTKRFFCEETVIQYKPNDIFVISTDGIAEARLRGSVESEEERYGMERLNSLLVQNADRGCSEIFEAIYTDVTESSLIEDDTTIIVLKMR